MCSLQYSFSSVQYIYFKSYTGTIHYKLQHTARKHNSRTPGINLNLPQVANHICLYLSNGGLYNKCL